MVAIQYKTGRNVVIITLIALTIFIGGTFFLHVVPPAVKDKIANGLLADFVVTIPALYYFIVVRPLKIAAKSVLAVISVCCIVAYLVLPQQQRDYILQIRKLTAVAELLFIIYAVKRISKIKASYKINQAKFPDPIFNLRAAMAHEFGNSLGVKVLASELAVLRYGLLFWKKEKSGLTEANTFTTHKDFGYIALWCIFLLAVSVEITAVHLLLLRWSHTAANILTALSLYGTIFLIADLSAILKRKVVITNGQLILRTGLRWRSITGLSNVASLTKINSDNLSIDSCFNGGIIKTSGNVLISFNAPVQVDKLYGASKQFTSVILNIDNFEAFADSLKPE